MELQPKYSGKVRDIYELGDSMLLMVTSDRISAFDVVMAEPIPDKGRVLTAMTAYWLDRFSALAPNHLVSTELSDFEDALGGTKLVDASGGELSPAYLTGRAMLTKKAQMLPIECIVRGYLSGSGWKEYSKNGTLHGYKLPGGLQESDQLPEALFTPSTKAETGHDENISWEAAVELVGKDIAEAAREISLKAYTEAAAEAAERGIIIADTKFELGFIDGELSICDEVLTPDSSRFWPADEYKVGATPPSFDKQPVRDWLESTGWDKTPPPPSLPTDVVVSTAERYRQAYEIVTGKPFSAWPGAGN